jgi:oxepin-CoA hydrolase/3-oxo-5,6-dehydrosuberyl-CoA semialdehyde dehydrogenase
LKEALEKVVVGDTKEKDVKMGFLVGRKQAEEVLSKVSPAQRCRPDRGMSEHVNLVGDNVSKEAFMSPILLKANNTGVQSNVHHIEAFDRYQR